MDNEELLEQLQILEEENSNLENENDDLKWENEQLEIENGKLKYEIDELKQKQTPKKIFHRQWIGIDGVPYDLCPTCKTNLCTNGLFPNKKENYCGNCGQKLDWSYKHDYD